MSGIRSFVRYKEVIFALIGILLISCNDLSFNTDGKPSSPNVLVITMDTTRADRIGCYGYKPAETPALDQLAREGARFEHAYSQIPYTLPSHITLFTGMYPPEHGVRDNFRNMLAEGIPTMAEAFAGHGYRTGAFVSATVLNAMFGLDRGFAAYSDQMADEDSGNGSHPEVPANLVSDRALNWLEKNGDEPFFCWVHFYSPHDPYNPPSPFSERLEDRYDGEIAFMDSQISRLLDWLNTRSLRKNTLVIAVGDHGESLEEHGELTHAFFIYDSTIRVPMIFSAPGWFPNAEVVEESVGVADIFPTVMELMGWSVAETVSGKSFLPALHGKKIKSRAVYAESDAPFYNFGWAKLRSLVKGEWQYIRAPRPELYNISRDPHELKNCLEGERAMAQELDQELSDIEKAMKIHGEKKITLDEKTKAALESLGYIQGSDNPGPAAEEKHRKDPKDMIEVWRRVTYGRGLVGEGKLEEGIKEIEIASGLEPRSSMIEQTLGHAYKGLGDRRKAKQHFEKALELNPEYFAAHKELAMVLYEDGQLEESIAHFEVVIRETPFDTESLWLLANAEMSLGGDLRKSEETAKKVLQLEPDNARVRYLLGQNYAKQGRLKDAASSYQAALRIKEDFWEAQNDLSDLLLEQGDIKEAIEAARKATELMPSHPLPFFTLAEAYAASDMKEQAITALKKAVEKGFEDAKFLKDDKHLQSLRKDPRFEEIIVRLEAKSDGVRSRSKKK